MRRAERAGQYSKLQSKTRSDIPLRITENLLKVKTLVTLAIVFVLCIQSLRGDDISPIFAGFAGSIITYYFTKGDVDNDYYTKK